MLGKLVFGERLDELGIISGIFAVFGKSAAYTLFNDTG